MNSSSFPENWSENLKRNIAFIPLDGRPCCLDFALKLGTIAGYEVQTPPLEIFRNFMIENDIQEISSWLSDNIKEFEYLVLSIDMLGYGCFFASSRLWVDEATVLSRLELIKELKAKNPHLKIFASNVISRTTWAVRENEELEICNLIVEFSQLQYLLSHNYNDVDIARYKSLHHNIPGSYLDEYKSVRARNHNVNVKMIDWVKEGYIDFLVLSQADASKSGPHRDEQQTLMNLIFDRELLDKVIIYAGADETGQVLLTRAIQKTENTSVSFFPRYSSVYGAQITAGFEDLPLGKNFKTQLYAAGSHMAYSPHETDIRFFIHTPSYPLDSDKFIKDLACDETKFLPDPSLMPWEFVEALSASLNKGHSVALADIAFANGCDRSLLQLLLKKISPAALHAFAGWNTSGNTLGTAIAHSILRWIHINSKAKLPVSEKTHFEFLFERFMDDYFYQSLVKPEVCQALRERNIPYKLPDEVFDKVNFLIKNKLHRHSQSFFGKNFKGYPLSSPLQEYIISSIENEEIFLPWQRTFEVALNYTFSLKKAD